jgi:hypothetical protein
VVSLTPSQQHPLQILPVTYLPGGKAGPADGLKASGV